MKKCEVCQVGIGAVRKNREGIYSHEDEAVLDQLGKKDPSDQKALNRDLGTVREIHTVTWGKSTSG